MKSNDTAFTGPAMDVIRRVDPELADQIDAAPEPITVAKSWVDVAVVILPIAGLEEAMAAAEDLISAYGMTLTVHKGRYTRLNGYIFLNKAAIEAKAEKLGVPVANFTADMIVHEFKHHQGYGEQAAYAAGAEFAREMGEPKIARYSEAVARQQHAG